MAGRTKTKKAVVGAAFLGVLSSDNQANPAVGEEFASRILPSPAYDCD
jgi:hypothetical protein